MAWRRGSLDSGPFSTKHNSALPLLLLVALRVHEEVQEAGYFSRPHRGHRLSPTCICIAERAGGRKKEPSWVEWTVVCVSALDFYTVPISDPFV